MLGCCPAVRVCLLGCRQDGCFGNGDPVGRSLQLSRRPQRLSAGDIARRAPAARAHALQSVNIVLPARAAGVLPGYFQGKKRAEDALAINFPTSGVALRPGFIRGTRYVGGVGVPLDLVGAPPCSCVGLVAVPHLRSTSL
jgi:hypothetical protein